MRSSWWADLLPTSLDAIAEAAWIAALYLLVEIAWGGGRLLVGIPQLAVVVAAGIGIGIALRRRVGAGIAMGGIGVAAGRGGRDGRQAARADTIAGAGRGDVAAATGAVLLAAIAGWAISPDVRASLAAFDVPAALSLHPGGWLVGLALLRGLAHGDVLDEEREAGGALRVGLAALVGVWLLGRTIGGADRALFQDTAIADTVTFMAAALLGVGVAGMKALSGRSGALAAGGTSATGSGAGLPGDAGAAARGALDLDWKRNREWLILLCTVVAGMIVVALPAVSAAGRGVVESVLALLWIATELIVLVVVLRAIPRAVSLSIPFLLGGFVIVLVLRLIGFRLDALSELIGQVRNAVQFGTGLRPDDGPGNEVTIFGALLVAVAIGVVILLARAWLRRRIASPSESVFEERSVMVERTAFRLSRPAFRRGVRRRERPTDAVSAYRSLLEQLDGDAELRRAAGESPAEHARRIVELTPGSRSVRRLALDYELARFGGRSLSGREEARALGRWAALQPELRHRPKPEKLPEENALEARARRRTAREHRDEDQRPFGAGGT